ncbi:MAG: winged helix DNA-binding protein, partial [Bacteriovoracaceae bacterium]|nr:winged helix DNA-binding protein [Bacteriovoracaceae bacterium]
MFRLHKSLEVFFLQIGQGVEISSQDCMILLSLLFEKRSVKPSELLLTFDFSKSTISQAISRLEGRNLVARVSNDKDARRVAFRITRKGLEYANSLIAKLEKADLDLRDVV